MSVAPSLNLSVATKITGWMSEGELQFLAEKARDADKILEVGSFQGRSTRALADNSGPNALIVAVDPWNYTISPDIKSDIMTYSIFNANLRDHIKAEKVIPVKKFFKDYETSLKFDFIFIDGDHYAKEVRHDINKALKLLSPGGIIAGHDYCENWPDVKLVVDNFFPKVNLVETIWWTKKC